MPKSIDVTVTVNIPAVGLILDFLREHAGVQDKINTAAARVRAVNQRRAASDAALKAAVQPQP